MNHHTGLSRPGTGHHQNGTVPSCDGTFLLWVEFVEKIHKRKERGVLFDPPERIVLHYICDVQFVQPVALIGMAVKQYEHSFVVGAAGAGSLLKWLIERMIKNNTNAITRELIVA